MRQIIVDTETTGLEVNQGHRIIEIACIEMAGRRTTQNHFHTYLNPEREIDFGAQQVHGISLDFLADKPHFKSIADAFIAFISDAELIIHNAPFDVGFINAELKRIKKPLLTDICKVTDTLAMARELHPGKKNNLNALCERYAVDNTARSLHGALLDAELLAEVYVSMTRGQDSLAIGLESGHEAHTNTPMKPRPISLKIIRANSAEIALHHTMLAGIDQASGGKTVWKSSQ